MCFFSFLGPECVVDHVRSLAAVELNSYIAILAPPKHQKQPHNSGAILIIFSFIATVHIYL